MMPWETLLVLVPGMAVIGYCIGRAHADHLRYREERRREERNRLRDELNGLSKRILALECRS